MKSPYNFSLWRLRLLSWPGLIAWLVALVLGLAVLGVQGQILGPQRQGLADLSVRVSSQPVVDPIRPAPAKAVSHDAVADTLVQFPEVRQAPQVWMKFEELAAKYQIPFEKQVLEWHDQAELPLTRMSFSLSSKVAEAPLRKFLVDAKAAIPTLVIPQFNIKRGRSLDSLLDTDLQLAVYFRRES